MSQPSILVVGITGSLGNAFATAAKELGIHLNVLVRPETAANPDKVKNLEGFTIVQGDVGNVDSLNAACQGKDVVISLVSDFQSQLALVNAAAAAGVKRFVPSEFSCCLIDPKSVDALGYQDKLTVREAIKATGMAFTSIQNNGFFDWFAPGCFNMLADPYPETVEIYGDGNLKIGMSEMTDIARVTLTTVSDPRTENQHVLISFPGTLYTQHEMVELWEKISGTKVKLTYLNEEEADKRLEIALVDKSKDLDKWRLLVVKGYVYRQLADCRDREGVLRATDLYPHIKGMTLEEYYKNLVAKGRPAPK